MRLLLFISILLISHSTSAADPWDEATSPDETYKKAMIAKNLGSQIKNGVKLFVDASDACDFDASTMSDRQVRATILTLVNVDNVKVEIVKSDKVEIGFIHIKAIDPDLAKAIKVAKRQISPWHSKDPDDDLVCHEYKIDGDAFVAPAQESKDDAALTIALHPKFEFKLFQQNCEGLEISTPEMDQVERINLLY